MWLGTFTEYIITPRHQSIKPLTGGSMAFAYDTVASEAL